MFIQAVKIFVIEKQYKNKENGKKCLNINYMLSGMQRDGNWLLSKSYVNFPERLFTYQ